MAGGNGHERRSVASGASDTKPVSPAAPAHALSTLSLRAPSAPVRTTTTFAWNEMPSSEKALTPACTSSWKIATV